MGNKHYHNYSKPFRREDGQVSVSPTTSAAIDNTADLEITTTVDSVEEPEVVVDDTVEAAPELPTTVDGIVSGCKKLNVRNKPTTAAAILTAIDEGTEVVIEQPTVLGEFYKVTLANGVTGYCMKKFITVK